MVSPRRAALVLDTREARETAREWCPAGHGKGINTLTAPARHVTHVRVIVAACWLVIGLAALATF